MSKEILQQILLGDEPDELKALCKKDGFYVGRSTRVLQPKYRDDLYLEATENIANVHVGGIDIRAQDLYVTSSNDYGSWYYCFEYKIGDSDWKVLYEDNDQNGSQIGDIEPCKQFWGIEIHSFVLYRFIMHTLCNMKIDLFVLEEHFAYED